MIAEPPLLSLKRGIVRPEQWIVDAFGNTPALADRDGVVVVPGNSAGDV